VYAAEASDVETVLIDGQVLMRARELTILDEQAVIREAKEQSHRLTEAIA
jgi:5-methylthioadenosine/S-adenosylhomocysteine deaminase